jgi:protein-disulfide isomerase
MTRLTLPVGKRDHTLGVEKASITLVEYGNYACAHCAQTKHIVEEIRRRLNGDLRFVYRHFPHTGLHSSSQRAAEAAEAAGAQGWFWEMHRLLFEHPHDLSDATIGLCAATLGLDMPRFLRDLKQGVYAEKVREDFESGLRSRVNGTPTFYINGVRHDDYWDADTLLAAMERSRMATEDKCADYSFQGMRLYAQKSSVKASYICKSLQLLQHGSKRLPV